MYLDLEGINKLSKEYEEDTKALREELFRLSWYMRGGMTLDQAFQLSLEDRQLIAKIIEENLETTKKTGWHFF